MLWVHVLADVPEGLQASVPQIGIHLGHLRLRAKCWDELVPLAPRQFYASDSCENGRDLATDGRLASLERVKELVLDLNLEVDVQVYPIVFVLRVLYEIIKRNGKITDYQNKIEESEWACRATTSWLIFGYFYFCGSLTFVVATTKFLKMVEPIMRI